MRKAEQKWRSVDTVEQDGEIQVLQQRVYVEYSRDDDGVYTDPGRNHRLKPLSEVV